MGRSGDGNYVKVISFQETAKILVCLGFTFVSIGKILGFADVNVAGSHELDIEVREADIDLFDAYTADEVFLTSTSLYVCPVSSVNGSPIGDGGVPGPVTDRLQKAYSGLVGIDVVGQYLARLG